MAIWKTLTRGYQRLVSPIESSEITIHLLSQTSLEIELFPYQVLYAEPSFLQHFSHGITLEPSGKIFEVTYSKTEGLGKILLSHTMQICRIPVAADFFCAISAFICGTSQLKVLETNKNYEVTGKGSLFIGANEVIELEEGEKILIREEALVGFESIKKELVKVSGIRFWDVTGPGKCAILWGKNSQTIEQKSETEEIKEFKEVDEKPAETLLTNIFGKNDILT